MMGFYMVIVFVAILVAYAGTEETLKLFAYADLQLRYAWIQFRMGMMRRKLKSQLVRDTANFEKFLEGYKDDE